MNGSEAWSDFIWDGLIDESIESFSDGLYGFDGGVNDGVDEERAWSIGIGGNEPIEIDPHQVPDHDVDGVR